MSTCGEDYKIYLERQESGAPVRYLHVSKYR